MFGSGSFDIGQRFSDSRYQEVTSPMEGVRRAYLKFYLVVYALYCLFNKGIAYSYLCEVLFIVGIGIILLTRRSYEFAWNRRIFLLVFFVAVTFIYMIRGVLNYNVLEVVRDSVMFNYIGFVFIVFLFKDNIAYFMRGMIQIYKWYPLLISCFFLLSSYIPFFENLRVFGGFRLFHYKFGDMAVHLFIATMLYLNGYIKVSRRFLAINFLLIVYLFLIVSSYSRAGMCSYLASLGTFFLYSKDRELKARLKGYLKYIPIAVLLALPLYLSTNVGENFQGRELSLSQLKENAVSIVTTDESSGSLNDNKVWRLVWWAKIIDYTFTGKYFLAGKGLGMSLALDDDIEAENSDGENELRSPHNFHLTVLARFGVPFFFIWLYWVFLQLKKIRQVKLDPHQLLLLCVTLVFILNASFDVFLEGPMGAFPFWTFIGLSYAHEAWDTTPQS